MRISSSSVNPSKDGSSCSSFWINLTTKVSDCSTFSIFLALPDTVNRISGKLPALMLMLVQLPERAQRDSWTTAHQKWTIHSHNSAEYTSFRMFISDPVKSQMNWLILKNSCNLWNSTLVVFVFKYNQCTVPEITTILQDSTNSMRNLHQIGWSSADTWQPLQFANRWGKAEIYPILTCLSPYRWWSHQEAPCPWPNIIHSQDVGSLLSPYCHCW